MDFVYEKQTTMCVAAHYNFKRRGDGWCRHFCLHRFVEDAIASIDFQTDIVAIDV